MSSVSETRPGVRDRGGSVTRTRDPGLIFDVGMHNGDDTAYYLRLGYHVVAVEANPVMCDRGRARFAQALADGRLVIEPVAVADSTGTATFFVNNEKSEFSSLNPKIAGRSTSSVEELAVTSVRLRDLLAKHGIPHYLKIDIETADWACLDDLLGRDREELPLYVSVEAHRLDYLCRLWVAGYRRFKVVDQLAHNSPLRNGLTNETWLGRRRRTLLHYVDRLDARLRTRAFPPGSSGPFGEHTPGEWRDLEALAYEWLHFKTSNHRRGSLNPRSWYDFHATF